MKFRHVFTVVRELPEDLSLAQAKEDFAGLEDAKGEYLYGGWSAAGEKITVALEMQLPPLGLWVRANSTYLEQTELTDFK